jgi:hypothetical protein
MCPEELTLFATSLAIAISKDRTTDEIDLTAVILSQIASSLATISIQRQQCEDKKGFDVEEGTDSGTTSSIIITS